MAFLIIQGPTLNLRVLFLRGIYYSFLTEGVKTDQELKLSNYLLVSNLKPYSHEFISFFSSLVGNFKMKKFGSIGH